MRRRQEDNVEVEDQVDQQDAPLRRAFDRLLAVFSAAIVLEARAREERMARFLESQHQDIKQRWEAATSTDVNDPVAVSKLVLFNRRKSLVYVLSGVRYASAGRVSLYVFDTQDEPCAFDVEEWTTADGKHHSHETPWLWRGAHLQITPRDLRHALFMRHLERYEPRARRRRSHRELFADA